MLNNSEDAVPYLIRAKHVYVVVHKQNKEKTNDKCMFQSLFIIQIKCDHENIHRNLED